MSDSEMMLHYTHIEEAKYGDYLQRFRPTLLEDRPFLKDYIGETFDRIFKKVGKKKRLLDIGCGTGFYHPLLLEYTEDLLGIDFSRQMLSMSRFVANDRSRYLIQGDIRNLPLPGNSIDGMFSWDVLHHVTGPEGLEDVIREIHRVLEPGGHYIGMEPNILNPLIIAYCIIRPEEHGALFTHSKYLRTKFKELFTRVELVPNNCIISYVDQENVEMIRKAGRAFTRWPLSLFAFREILIARK